MHGTPVHGPAVLSPMLLLGQAPGPHEAKLGRPFAYTAGKTLFRWFEEHCGVDEARFRDGVYIAAVARCFPGKAAGGGDRVPDDDEISRCRRHLSAEVALLRPKLLIAVGNLAIRQALGPEAYGPKARLADVVGTSRSVSFLGGTLDVLCLPHPSGLSAWPKVEPGKTLLRRALATLAAHPVWRETFHKG